MKRVNAKRIVAYFRSSATEKGTLEGIQIQMGRRSQSLVTDVDTLEQHIPCVRICLFQLKEPVAAALNTWNRCNHTECFPVFIPSISKVVPLMNMLHHSVLAKSANISDDVARPLSDNRLKCEHVANMEFIRITTVRTLPNPRFKTLTFLSLNKTQGANSD